MNALPMSLISGEAFLTIVVDASAVMPHQCHWYQPVMNQNNPNFVDVINISNASFAGGEDTGNTCIAGVFDTGETPLESFTVRQCL